MSSSDKCSLQYALIISYSDYEIDTFVKQILTFQSRHSKSLGSKKVKKKSIIVEREDISE